MPQNINVTGIGLKLESVTVLTGYTTLLVRFTQDVLALNPAGANDALNIANYTLGGPVPVTIIGAAPNMQDPQAIYITLSGPLSTGTWTLAVANVKTIDGFALGTPNSEQFVVTITSNADDVSGGAVNDTPETLIRKHLPRSLAGKFWNGLIAALAVGDQLNWDNAILAFDQLFKSSASGFYLDRKAADDGLSRPLNIGMSDELFRRLAIKTSVAKLTPKVLLEIMEVFYGSDAVRANISTALTEPFSLTDGDSLSLLMDEKNVVTVTFQQGDFSAITKAKAVEVAAAITRALRESRNEGFAIAFTDAVTNLAKVKIYSGSLGLGSSVRVTGGRAQLGLNFPDILSSYTGTVTSGDAYNWVVTSPQPGVNQVQLTNAGGTSKVNLSIVQAGDYVVFQAANSTIPAGIYTVLDVNVAFSGAALVQSFNIAGNVANHSFLQLANSDMTFFRPTRATILSSGGDRAVIVAQASPGELDIQIPATTQAVGRQNKTASYIRDTVAFGITSIQRLGTTVTVTTSSPHGLLVGNFVTVQETVANPVTPAITSGTPSSGLTSGTSDASLATIWTQTGTQDLQSTRSPVSVELNDGRVFVTGGYYTHSAVTTYEATCQLFTISATSTLPGGAKQYTYAWSDGGSLATARAYHAGSLLTDTSHSGNVLVTGGITTGGGTTNTVELYTPVANAAGSWATKATMSAARAKHKQVTLQSNKVLVVGGTTNTTTGITACELYDPVGNSWSAAGSMVKARVDHRCILLNTGKVLVVGGRANPTDTVGYHSSCELYDPTGNTWSSTGRMTWSRIFHTLTLLSDGRVLVVGGSGAKACAPTATPADLVDAEVYDPSTGRWSPAGRLGTARGGHGAVYLSTKKKVLVAGNNSNQNMPAEYFDEATFTWRNVPNNPSASNLGLAQSLTLVNGSDMALLHGGFDDVVAGSTKAYLFQGADDVFAVGGMNGTFPVSAVASSTQFSYTTPNYSGFTSNLNTSAIIKPMGALPGGLIAGPFTFDTEIGTAITGTATVATQDVLAGQQYRSLDVVDATVFPDEEGWLVIGFGSDSAVFPVKYLGGLSSTALSLDYSFKFPKTNAINGFTIASATRSANMTTLTLNLPAGVSDHGILVGQVVFFKSTSGSFTAGYVTVTARTSTTIAFADTGSNTTVTNPGTVVVSGPSVTLLKQKGVWAPDHPEEVGASYVTASSAGRTAAVTSLNDTVAAGINTSIEVLYPSDRGLGGAGLPASGQTRLSDKVSVWGGDNVDAELATARGTS